MTNNPAEQKVNISKFFKSEQTERYVKLKPIADRFNRIASEIPDEEIKNIIKNSIREQLKKISFVSCINEMLENYLEEHPEEILDMYKNGLRERLR